MCAFLNMHTCAIQLHVHKQPIHVVKDGETMILHYHPTPPLPGESPWATRCAQFGGVARKEKEGKKRGKGKKKKKKEKKGVKDGRGEWKQKGGGRIYKILPANFNKFAESKCYFLGNLVVFMKLPLTTSAEVSGSTPGHG